MSGAAGLRGALAAGVSAVVVASTLGAAAVAALAAREVVDDARERARAETRRALRSALALDTSRLRLDAALGRSLDVDETYRDDVLVASAAWPEAVGTRAPRPERPDGGGTGFVWSVPTAAGRRPAWVVPVPEDPGARGSRFVGAFLDAPERGLSEVRSAGGSLTPAPGPDGAESVAVPASRGEPTFVLTYPSTADRATARGAVAFAGVAVVLLAGLAAATAIGVVRAATRPLDSVVDAFEAIADGRADYDFPVSREAALGEIVASYSRMRRALDRERERVRTVERVAAWKETARRVAHEVKNPLVPIRLSVENLVKARQKAPERFEAMFVSGTRAILEEVDRLGRVVSEFTEYARLPAPRLASHDLPAIVEGIVTLHAGRQDVTVRHERVTEVPPVSIDRDLIGQAIRNVVDNAVREAESRRGTVVVCTGVDEGGAFVTVRDDGPGFDSAVLPHVFEPYVTGRAGGTGLGLAIAQRIAVEHGGTLSAANVAGGGAEVTLRLPVHSKEPR